MLHRALSFGAELGRVSDVPRLRGPRPPAPRAGFVEDEVLARILAELPARIRPAVEVAALTGWRVHSEVLTRKWGHVAGGCLRIDPGEAKSGEGRNFPIVPGSRLAAILDAQAAAADAIARFRCVRSVPCG
jgi:hypothetical protein